MKKSIIVLLVIQLFLVGCGRQQMNTEIKNEIQLLSSGSIDEINELLFGYTDSLTNEDNIIGYIASKSSIKILSISSTEIEIEVTAPNMKGAISSVIDNNPEYTDVELLKELLIHADTTEKICRNLKLNYTYTDKQLEIDYFNEEFIDAFTGGLLSDYKEFRSDLKQSYLEVD